jgi:chromate transporter
MTEVLIAFLRLGCMSFGGPIAHLGYFRSEFVERRQWCTEDTFAELVALAQSLPGPASSQVAFALGLLRARWAGGLAAWIGFTMPSALLMFAFAFGHKFLTNRLGLGVVHGLQLVAVAVVAQAILAMRKSLAPDWLRMTLALAAACIVLLGPPALGTVAAITVGGFLGWLLLPSGQAGSGQQLQLNAPKTQGLAAAALFLLFLLALPLAAEVTGSRTVTVFNAFYQTGALVFGGGHVVLPLLENAIVAKGWVDQQTFLSGYGAAQAIPGPLFTFAGYLGAVIKPSPNPFFLGALALAAIFLPGLLIVVAVLPVWNTLREKRQMRASLQGINASVVGILAAAFVQPVWTSAVHSRFDFILALAAFLSLIVCKLPSWSIVLGVSFLSALRARV